MSIDKITKEVEKIGAISEGRPIICTEWMGRVFNSFFETHLPFFMEQQINCFNWGLVNGKTQTHFPWGSKEGADEPDVWFHDILRTDGTPYSATDMAALAAHIGNGK